MKNRCEICGCTFGLEEVYACACDEGSPSATLCEKCKKKYFDYMLPKSGALPINQNIPSVPYIPWLDYASNLVYAYNVRYGGSNKSSKKEATMQATYNGFTGELVKLERTGREFVNHTKFINFYDISIYDSEKQVTHSFTGVKLEDVKFFGGAVAFGG